MSAQDADQDQRPAEQTTRNLDELLQELRVMQTGVQILTGFLLTVPFTDRFPELSDHQERLYLGILIGAVLTTLVIVAPVCYHRLLFRKGRREWLVSAAQICALGGLSGLALISTAAVLLIFDVVVGGTGSVIAASAVALAFIAMWTVVPSVRGTRGNRGRQGS